ncbi:uncharacterized protein BP01DRAFT_381450 [Aspergillus saccharolyticus JOP 1030-1]|uniref:NB-ARC domain-containing protein n=1 Tax=Aspergillus saccharolyticus JOP 1030-1 TaxID=1450539 RepID=A0A318ZFR3_9EURO|nr:hypothetical protein BP01DRAFT_381450 [Aspergillus saccharolyticus JOP 1030-1]PYH46396.1 hypothetical protein BP01DRAFT_381450 [Aspergillus saccharolyticus JOP 1030-1]
MGRFKLFHAAESDEYPKKMVVVVPGLDANSLAEQTCPHFTEWIQSCYASLKPSLEVWIYCHGIKAQSLQSWEQVCQAGKELYHELVALCKDRIKSPDSSLVTIGYRLGAFILKKAIIEAHHQQHRPDESAFFDYLEAMVMVGDPKLKDANREEWSMLVQRFLLLSPSRHPLDICSQQALHCLKAISDRFEEITVYSRLFHITSETIKAKRFYCLRSRTGARFEGCVCDASFTVRKWTTADLDEDMSEDEGEQKRCVFHLESRHRRKLDLIAANAWDPRPRIGNDAWGSTADVTPSAGVEAGASFVSAEPNSSVTAIESCSSADHSNFVDHSKTSDEPIPLSEAGRIPSMMSVCSGSEFDLHQAAKLPCRDTLLSACSIADSKCSLQFHPAEEIYSPGSAEVTPYRQNSGNHSTDDLPEKMPYNESNARATGPKPYSPLIDATRVKHNTFIKDTSGTNSGRPLPLQMRLPDRAPNFCGRQDILESLRAFFTQDLETSPEIVGTLHSQKVAILTGVPGIGKTAVAREYVHHNGLQFSSIMWIQASHRQSIAESFHETAFALQLIEGRTKHTHAQSQAKLMSWLRETRSNWLLIFDDADDLSAVRRYIPRCGHGNILITSRSTDLSLLSNAAINELSVNPLSEEEESELFHDITGLGQEQIELLGLRRLSGGNPLASSMIARAMKTEAQSSTRQSAREDDLLKVLHYSSELVSQQKRDRLCFTPTMWRWVSTNMEQLTAEAKGLCSVVSYLDAYDIPDSTLHKSYGSRPKLQTFPVTDQSFYKARIQCVRSGLCSETSSHRSLRMHRVVQSILRDYLTDNQEQGAAFTTAVQLLLDQWPSQRKFKNVVFGYWPEFSRIHTQCHRLSEVAASALTTPDQYAPFIQLILQCAWYNSHVLKNAEEDVELVALAHDLLAILHREKVPIASHSPEDQDQAPQRLVHIDKRTCGWKVIDTKGQKPADYIALSYSWTDQNADPHMPVKLTKSTLARCRDGGRVADMPRLYRDACNIASSLGIRYLWIDALCVIQDDPADREAELSKVAEIYRNASATITRQHFPRIKLKLSEASSCKMWFAPYSILCHRCASSSQKKPSPGVAILHQTMPDFLKGYRSDLTGLAPLSELFNVEIISLPGIDRLSTERGEANEGKLENSQKQNLPEPGCSELGHTSAKEAPGSATQRISTVEGSERRVSRPDISRYSDSDQESNHAARPDKLKRGLVKHEPQRSDADLTVLSESVEGRLKTTTEAVENAIRTYKQEGSFRTLAAIIRARDQLSVYCDKSPQALSKYVVFTTYLALIAIQQECPEEGMDLLQDLKASYNIDVSTGSDIDCCSIGRFHMAWGDAQLALSHNQGARGSYKHALAAMVVEEEEAETQTAERADLFALAQLKIAHVYTNEGKFQEAHNALREAVAHFECCDTREGQIQYARALYRQSLVYGRQGNERLRKVRLAAAKQAMENVLEDDDDRASFSWKENIPAGVFERFLQLGMK